MQTKENDVYVLRHVQSDSDKKSGMKNLLQFINPFTDEDSVKNLPPAIVPILKGFDNPPEECYSSIPKNSVSQKCLISKAKNDIEPIAATPNFNSRPTSPTKKIFEPLILGQLSPMANPTVYGVYTMPIRETVTQSSDFHLLGYGMDDVGNVERFASLYGDGILYCTVTKQWYIWNGKVWQQDVRNVIKNMAEQVMKRYKDMAQRNFDSNRNASDSIVIHNKNLLNHSMRSNNNAALNALVAMLEYHFPTLPEEFNTNPYLLNVRNGTIDLRTGIIKPHDKKDLITQYTDIDYIPNARPVYFGEFIQEIFCNDHDLINYVQTALGYCITGDTSEQCFFIAYGDGSNGKSTLIETIGHLFNNYVRTIPISILLDSYKGGTASPEIANAIYSRIVLSGENKDGDFFNESKIKLLTGGNKLSVRQLYCNNFEYFPKFKLWIDTNYLPKIKGMDYGIWRRIKVIPFQKKIDDHQKDITLPIKLRQDSEAILAWLVDGAVKYYTYGLRDTPAIQEALLDYKESEDTISPFIENCLIKSEGCSIMASDLYQAYLTNCAENGISSVSTSTQFGRVLTNRGFEKCRISKGYAYKNVNLIR